SPRAVPASSGSSVAGATTVGHAVPWSQILGQVGTGSLTDTVTRPSAGMRRAMARAAVGDDDYGEDPAVNELQRLAAGILGMEEALFVPTVTMANLIAVMCHCQRRGGQLLLGRDAHLHLYEHGGAAQVAGVHSQALPDLPDGTFNLDQLELTIREAHGSRYHLRPELICLENTHSSAGGRVLPLTYLQQVRGLADCYGLRVHMDGARLMNAAVAQDMEPAHITQHCDSVSLCFSKGLGAPAGAVLAGRREFVDEAWRARKLLGGGMRQAGVLAAAARVGLRHMEATLRRDHNNARRFAEGIQELNSPLCSINLKAVETNIVMVSIRGDWPSPAELCEQLRAVSEEEVAETGQAVSVLLFPWSARTVRAVWHHDVSARDTELAKNKLEFVARKCQEKLARGLWPTSPSAGGA
uniref:Aromatic amino acid beta-eliminating lyase/threonine aldolase domain-containing protein n=1 Tax=Falco tinnunculus TaxID=100819 RepID=A0A8C4TLW3_FALTI